MDDELEQFKREVNLTELAASLGYAIEGSKGGASVTMRRGRDDDKIVVRRGADGHWTYFSVRDDGDNGTVIDFLQNRRVRSLGDVRRQLRDWLRIDRPRVAPELYRQTPAARDRDVAGIRRSYAAAAVMTSQYLLSRGLRRETLRDPRFRHSYRVDRRGNVLFPHEEGGVVVGYEIKNRGFRIFVAGGRRTLWRSAGGRHDDRLVIAEAPIDALSYHQLFQYRRCRYVATAGALSPAQLVLIGEEIASLAPRSRVVIASDNDAGGERFTEKIEGVVGDVPLRRHLPPEGKDWNEYLQAVERRRPRGPELAR
jgi:hypothetical protein